MEAEHVHELIHLDQGGAARRADTPKDVGDALGILRRRDPPGSGLDDHHGHVVADDVVQLARNPSSLSLRGQPREGFPLALELAGALLELDQDLPPGAHDRPHQPRRRRHEQPGNPCTRPEPGDLERPGDDDQSRQSDESLGVSGHRISGDCGSDDRHVRGGVSQSRQSDARVEQTDTEWTGDRKASAEPDGHEHGNGQHRRFGRRWVTQQRRVNQRRPHEQCAQRGIPPPGPNYRTRVGGESLRHERRQRAGVPASAAGPRWESQP